MDSEYMANRFEAAVQNAKKSDSVLLLDQLTVSTAEDAVKNVMPNRQEQKQCGSTREGMSEANTGGKKFLYTFDDGISIISPWIPTIPQDPR